MNQAFTQELSEQAIYRFKEYLDKIEASFERLTEEEVWQRPNPASNSMGNLILHLCGNIRQYAISSLGHQEDHRNRDAEFAAEDGLSKQELMNQLRQTCQEAMAVFEKLDETELLKKRYVQGYHFTGVGVLIHVVEHFSYHTGQVVFWTKQLRNQGFDFYKDIDLNAKNESSD